MATVTEVAPAFKQRRALDKWKVRYCAHCGQYEYDAGSPRGWIKLQGPPPEGALGVSFSEETNSWNYYS